jgi:hypothetical protein
MKLYIASWKLGLQAFQNVGGCHDVGRRVRVDA